jgi:hypothetical protein
VATPDDARLIIDLSQWAVDRGFHQANAWLWKNIEDVQDYDAFVEKYPADSEERPYPWSVLGYFENIGLFHKHDVIDRAMLFDWLEFDGYWQVLENFVVGNRKAKDNPELWTNFEKLVADQRAWREAERQGVTS